MAGMTENDWNNLVLRFLPQVRLSNSVIPEPFHDLVHACQL
jgi:hypothetical protein